MRVKAKAGCLASGNSFSATCFWSRAYSLMMSRSVIMVFCIVSGCKGTAFFNTRKKNFRFCEKNFLGCCLSASYDCNFYRIQIETHTLLYKAKSGRCGDFRSWPYYLVVLTLKARQRPRIQALPLTFLAVVILIADIVESTGADSTIGGASSTNGIGTIEIDYLVTNDKVSLSNSHGVLSHASS